MHEYIVVGSGAGGGPVAANLAEAGHSVLVLEAGGAPESLNYPVPGFHPGTSEEPDMSWQFFVDHYSDPEQARRDWKYVKEEGGIFYPRAGTLGGCTAHNAMIFVYPANRDWQRIADLTGDDSWEPTKMRRIFQRMERCEYRRVQRWFQRIFHWNPSRHGFDGWLGSQVADPGLVLGDDELLGVLKKSVFRLLFSFGNLVKRVIIGAISEIDPNDWRLIKLRFEGTRFTPLHTSCGNRSCARERLQAVAEKHPDRLEIRTGALVTRVLFAEDDPTRAIGVEYLEGEHLYEASPHFDPAQASAKRTAYASREVILAGGAFNTPQLLQLSGIGDPELLAEHGIEVRVPLPGVGENLQDRYEVGVVSRMKHPFRMLAAATQRPPVPGAPDDPNYDLWKTGGTGIYATNGAVLSVHKKSSPECDEPDLFIFALVTDFQGYYPGYSHRVQDAKDKLTWGILKGYTENRAGWVRIRSRDPRHRPDINFRYFDEGTDGGKKDLEAVVSAIQFVRKITKGYNHLVEAEEAPGPEVATEKQIADWVRDNAWGHHASGTAAIGADDDWRAVLDSRFRVRGTTGLRVVDASVFPRIPGLFIVCAVYIIGEKAGDVIHQDSQRPPVRARMPPPRSDAEEGRAAGEAA